jgi:hypothetical protein
MNSSLVIVKHRYDYGHDWYIQLFNTGKHVPRPFKEWSLIQASVSWNDYSSWPYIQIKSGTGTLFSVMFWVYRFGFDIGFVERTWNWGEYNDENETELV